jgi:hypothetical protein
VNGYVDDGYLCSGIGVDVLTDREEDNLFTPTLELTKRLSVYGNETYVPLEDLELCEMLRRLAQTKGFSLQGKMRMVFNGGVREIMSLDGDSILLQGDGFTPWTKPGTVHIGILEMYWVEPGRLSSDRDIVKESFEFALEHASSPKKWVMSPYKGGLDAYDNWLLALQEAKPNVFGLSYSGQSWAECRQQAALFLSEAADRIGGASASRLRDAAAIYQDIYEVLHAYAQLLPFEGKAAHLYMERTRLQQAVSLVSQAKRAEEAALRKLEGIISGFSE